MSARRGTSPRQAVLVAGAAAATLLTGALVAAPADAATPPVVILNGTTLTVQGDPLARNSLVVSDTAAGLITLNGTPVREGTVPLSAVQVVVIDGGGLDDTLRIDDPRQEMPVGRLTGGAGNDTLVGGSKGDTLDGGTGIDTIVGNAGDDILVGGAGNDKAVGGAGQDTVSLGDDSDQFTWSPGDGSDRVDGDGGTDTLLFNGVDRAPTDRSVTETFQFFSDGVRSKMIHIQLPAPNDPNDDISFSGFEQVKASMAGGPNGVVFFDNFSASDAKVVRVDLGPPVDPAQTQGAVNIAQFVGTAAARSVRVGGTPATGVTVTGLGPTELITRAQDLGIQVGLGSEASTGVVVDASQLAAGTVGRYGVSGAEGPDVLIGSAGDDFLFGGAGDDRLEGRDGDDRLEGGPGDDVLLGGPGNNILIQ